MLIAPGSRIRFSYIAFTSEHQEARKAKKEARKQGRRYPSIIKALSLSSNCWQHG